MFKLLRDSIFAPKKIIHYRAKSGWFTFFYIFLVSIIMGVVLMVGPLSYDGLSYLDRKDIIKAFKNTDAKIESGVFISSDEIEIIVNDISVGFYSTESYLLNVPNPPTFAVLNDKIYFVRATRSLNQVIEFVSIKSLPESIQNVDLYALTDDSIFFTEINNLIKEFKPWLVVGSFILGVIHGMFLMVLYAGISYLFISMMIRVGNFMKKGQLYKMFLYSSTAIVFAEGIMLLLGINGIVSLIFLFVAFIPSIVLEREIIKRIRIKMFGDGLMNNQSVVDKINKIISNQDKSDEDENSNDLDEDNNYNDNDDDN